MPRSLKNCLAQSKTSVNTDQIIIHILCFSVIFFKKQSIYVFERQGKVEQEGVTGTKERMKERALFQFLDVFTGRPDIENVVYAPVQGILLSPHGPTIFILKP